MRGVTHRPCRCRIQRGLESSQQHFGESLWCSRQAFAAYIGQNGCCTIHSQAGGSTEVGRLCRALARRQRGGSIDGLLRPRARSPGTSRWCGVGTTNTRGARQSKAIDLGDGFSERSRLRGRRARGLIWRPKGIGAFKFRRSRSRRGRNWRLRHGLWMMRRSQFWLLRVDLHHAAVTDASTHLRHRS